MNGVHISVLWLAGVSN